MIHFRLFFFPQFHIHFTHLLKILFTPVLVLLLVGELHAQETRNLLTDFYTRKLVNESLSRDDSWINYPSYGDREAWASIPEEVRVRTIKEGEKFLDYDWPSIKLTSYLEFTRSGDRSVVDRATNEQANALRSLALAELLEGKGRFVDDIINGVFAICEQTYWGSSAHFYLYGFEGSIANPTTVVPDLDEPIIDLMVGDMAADLSWVWYFFHEEFDKISPVISRRLKDEIKRKVLEPFYEGYDFWWITGWGEGRVNNWTTWCNYNMLVSILLIEDDPQKKEEAVYKTMSSIDLFINSYPDDGGSSEGPSYWAHAGGKLYDYLDLLKRNTNGKIDLFNHELIKNIGRYIYRVYVGNHNYFVNFADAPIRINHDPGRIFRYGRSIEDPNMKGFGAFLMLESDYGEKAIRGRLGESLENMFNIGDLEDTEAAEPLIPQFYLPDLDLAIARDKAGSTEGFYFAAKGGSNGELHNHNDVGSFMLYFNGDPVLIDVGVGTYTRETFGKGRYDIWTMQSNYHNLPLINGTPQHQGGNYKAENSDFAHSKNKVSYSTEISGAYPEEANVGSWTRAYTLERGKKFIVNDDFQLTQNSGKTTVHFMSGLSCRILEEGVLEFQGKDFLLQMNYNPSQLTAAIEPIEIDDPRLINSLGNEISRLVFTWKGDGLSENIGFEIKEKR